MDFDEALIKYKNSPEKLYELAKTDFEKLVAIEFFHLHDEVGGCKKDIKWQSWLIKGVFMLTAVAFVVQIISELLGR